MRGESAGNWRVGHNGILEYRVTWGSGLHGYQHGVAMLRSSAAFYHVVYPRVASVSLVRSRIVMRRWLSSEKTTSVSNATKKTAATTQTSSEPANKAKTWWTNAELWGTMSALPVGPCRWLLFMIRSCRDQK
jgi:hypothetical protein